MLGRPLLFTCLLVMAAPATALTVYKYTDANGVVTYSDQRVRGAEVFSFGQDAAARRALRASAPTPLPKEVRLEKLAHAAGETLLVHNDLYAPVQVELKLEKVDNAVGAPAKPIRWVLPPRSKIRLATLSPRDPSQPLRYTPRLRHALGDPRLQPQPQRYPLPWRGGPFRLSQGANGSYSHFTAKGRYAVDIAMPEGTPVVAARGGVVVQTESSQQGREPNPAGNYVRILHDDGTMGVYLHLMQGSVTVRAGQRVATGTLIARSGNTGRSTGPHLHFVVQRNVGLAVESIPFQFSQPVNSLPNFAVGGE